MPLTTPENFFNASGNLSGQPSRSSKPFLVSGSFGHLSLSSKMPSLSVSRTGQPSGFTPASSGQASHGRFTPSLSGSRSTIGQPFGAGPASRGQKSSLSFTPSPSVSGGQPSGATPKSFGHMSTVSTTPSLSASGGGGGSSFRARSMVALRPSITSKVWA